MANSLAPLGIRKILVYANPLTKQLLELFVDSENLFVATQIGDEVQLKNPHKAYQREGIEAMHWGFEFAEETTIKLPACRAGQAAQAGGAGRNDLTLTAPRTSRFYPCWNPVNNKLQLSEAFKRGVLQYIDQFSHFILAGYQVLSPDYPDGTTCIDYMLPTLEYLKELKDARPELKLHFECDTIPADKIRRGILKYVLPQMDSMGLNEVELDYFIKDMRGEKIGKLGGAGSVEYYFQGLMELAELTGLKRIHFHNLGYYLCIQHSLKNSEFGIRNSELRNFSPSPLLHFSFSPMDFQLERTRQAMILASVIAAQRALTGDVTSDVTFEQVKEIPFSQEGLEQMQAIAKHISAPASFFETGIFEYHGYNVIFLPTKVVRNPALTVGLGDTISAVAFLAE
jgi:ADP-dependent phosphofructokinase/glucokinase